jgi:hypothetical protein
VEGADVRLTQAVVGEGEQERTEQPGWYFSHVEE